MNPERALITNMIVNDRFCREIVPVFRPALLQTGYAREVSGWVLEYWGQYKKAPGRDIQNIYQHKRKSLRDDEEADNIAEFLRRLSAEYESKDVHNVDYAVQLAVHYLKTRSLEVLREQIDGALAEGNPLKGEQYLSTYTRVEPPMGEGVSVLRDPDKIITAFMEEEDVLFQFPGAFGEVAGWQCRGDFMSFLAPMKRGKTFMLWYTAEIAAHAGHRVVFFTLEMTERQMVRRAWQSLTGQPRKEVNVTIPSFQEEDGGRWGLLWKKEKRKAADLQSIEKFQKTLRRRFRTGDVKIVSLPAYSASVEDLSAHIDNMGYYDGYVPDVVIVDYADLVAPSRGFRGDYRHQLDDTWKKLRRMAQERNCLVVTASQAEKSSFNEDLTETHVAEDIRKLAHVTSMIGLNRTKAEEERGLMRVNQLAIRDGRRVIQQALLLQCLEIGRACLDSRRLQDVNLGEEISPPAKKERAKRRG